MAKDGREYEQLAESVFRRLLAQDALCADVRQDVTLQGRGATHQIDVLFRFHAAGIEHLTLIECKDRVKPVNQEQVFAFHSVLTDIPGQPRGVMVSRSGYQRGAREYARLHGIVLYELRAPKDEDWDGLIREVRVRGTIFMPHWTITNVRLDRDWLRQKIGALGLPVLERSYVGTPEAWFRTDGAPFDLRDLLAPRTPQAATESMSLQLELEAPLEVEGIVIDGVPLTRLRVVAIDVNVSVREWKQDFSVRVDHLVAYCFRDVLDGTFRFLDATGAPLGSGLP